MPFMAEAYAAKKYAFVSDVMRLVVLEQYGGVYFDTDVEVLRDISPLLDDEGFIGFENEQFVNSGQVMAAVPHQPVVQAMIEEYKKLCFLASPSFSSYQAKPCVTFQACHPTSCR